MIEKNKDITSFTTFGIKVKAKYFAEYTNTRELIKILRSDEYKEGATLHIGGGSNLLFLSDFEGMVLHSGIRGLQIYDGKDGRVFLIAGAGEKWTDVVDFAVNEGLGGLENLAGIPGEAGASAVQNVGAYGVEAGDVIHAVECMDTQTMKTVRFTSEECKFAYRDSRFKHEGGRYIVLRVSYLLRRDRKAEHLDYGPLKDLQPGVDGYIDISQVRAEVLRLRDTKLPNPEVVGSAGSFFKNPVVDMRAYVLEIEPRWPEIPHWNVDGDDNVKLSAAWMIDQCGLKGRRCGGAEVWKSQPLVIANVDNATGEDVATLADVVRREVQANFGVMLQPEVNYIDTRIRVTVLGSGTSKGVPQVGCGCRVCRSADSKDKRLRASVLVDTGGQALLIDVSPDFREQALRLGLDRVDAALITHSHYDHVGGLDDLRPFCIYGPLPLYMTKDVEADLRRRLDYCFREHPYPGVPTFDITEINRDKPFMVGNQKVIPIEVMHGVLPVTGYRIGDFAYVTDAKEIAPEERDKLRGLKVLIVNGLRNRPHFAHFSIDEALEFIKDVAPEQAWLTHIDHEVLHAEVDATLPPNVHLAYDGLTIEI